MQLPSETFSDKIVIPNSDLNLFKKILFRNTMTKCIMSEKIETNQYGSLSEFYCDCLDIQHCIGILKGSKFCLSPA